MEFTATKKRLDINEALSFVNTIVNDYFDSDENGEYYDPFFGRLSEKVNFAVFYCGYDVKDKEPEQIYADMLDLSIKNIVRDIDRAQYFGLMNTIKEVVCYKLDILKSKRKDTLSQLLETIKEKVDKIDLSGIDADLINKTFQSMNDGTFEKKIAQAYKETSKQGKNLTDVIGEKNNKIKNIEDYVNELTKHAKEADTKTDKDKNE